MNFLHKEHPITNKPLNQDNTNKTQMLEDKMK